VRVGVAGSLQRVRAGVRDRGALRRSAIGQGLGRGEHAGVTEFAERSATQGRSAPVAPGPGPAPAGARCQRLGFGPVNEPSSPIAPGTPGAAPSGRVAAVGADTPELPGPEAAAAAAAGSPAPAARNKNPLLEIAITILVPALILMQLSGENRLGTTWALVVALSFPVCWGLWDAIKNRKLNWLAVLGVISTLLTGGIGLLKLDPFWLAVKEAAVPGLIGLAVLGSNWTRWPLIRILVFNPTLFDVERINLALAERRTTVPFELRLRAGTLLLAGTFFFSSVMNYILARWVVTSPAGTEAFNQELGRLTLLSYPVIALPSMAMMMGLMFWLARSAKQFTGLELGDMLRGS
jgi:hypothetical protein